MDGGIEVPIDDDSALDSFHSLADDRPFRIDNPTPICHTLNPTTTPTTQLFFALGSVTQSFPLMLLGRCIYGLGGENMSVAQSSLVAEWFRVGIYIYL